MIKPIRPGKLRGRCPDAIERSISSLMMYDCSFDGQTITIGPIDDYENPVYLLNDARRLSPIGTVHVIGTKKGIMIEVVLNARAIEIITNADRKEEKPNDCKNTVSGSESANC